MKGMKLFPWSSDGRKLLVNLRVVEVGRMYRRAAGVRMNGRGEREGESWAGPLSIDSNRRWGSPLISDPPAFDLDCGQDTFRNHISRNEKSKTGEKKKKLSNSNQHFLFSCRVSTSQRESLQKVQIPAKMCLFWFCSYFTGLRGAILPTLFRGAHALRREEQVSRGAPSFSHLCYSVDLWLTWNSPTYMYTFQTEQTVLSIQCKSSCMNESVNYK